MDRPVILNFTVELEEEHSSDGWGGWGYYEVAVVKVNGHEIARTEAGEYIDRENISEAAADLLKKLLEKS